MTLDVIVFLNVRTWLGQTPAGDPVPALLLTYPAQRAEGVDPGVVEDVMRRVAVSLGAAPAGSPVPEVGVRLGVRGADALMWFPGCAYALKIARPEWVRALASCGRALLEVGLDELSTVASVAEVDEYRQHAHDSGRMHLALADVGRRPLGGAA
ncbi:hypothetical protein OG331_31665 [Streptomyces sp. NBC_01017]|uniref:hypothetical protein n=1 Tax=Streptomyces sp. NBC_01017 TaxID=2903721 RepID=UPI0038692027|nr:hypothetical protein OG331_31665 [Streptomyces sp. NBC_01017]